MPIVTFRPLCQLTLSLAALAASTLSAASVNPQQPLPMIINAESQRSLEYDWPILKIGTGEYPDGPTGLTVFHFDRKVSVAVDARGGGPGTVNAPYMDIGYKLPELDSIVFAGGSWYGLEATTAVASALKDDGIRDGDAFAEVPNIAMSVGSIIFDFGARRLNEIYPDKRLAQATFRAAKTGSFPLGPHGAGRFAKTGALFGCQAHSGQGAAFKQIGDLKIAVFSVVNAVGVVTDREGKVVSCYKDSSWPETLYTSDLLNKHAFGEWHSDNNFDKKNTTISLVVTNQKLEPAELKRLAVQVHTSMGRALQPYASIFDGDVLYAVSTQELDQDLQSSATLGVAASELMWDAILASTPPQPKKLTLSTQAISNTTLRLAEGDYDFSANVSLSVKNKNGRLFARAAAKKNVYGINSKEDTELFMSTTGDLTTKGRYPLSFRFTKNELVINPGRWQQHGARR